MSSTGIINGNYDDLETDILDVNKSLFLNNVNILNLISDGINDISGNINNQINDVSGNLNDL